MEKRARKTTPAKKPQTPKKKAEKVTIPVLTASPIPQSEQPAREAYFNRELSWLAFNRRVLGLALDDKLPLLERVKFLAIVSSNLDEFFEIRVSGVIQQVDSGISERSPDGLEPKEQLRRIHSVVASLVDEQYRCWTEQLVPALAEQSIEVIGHKDLSEVERDWVQQYFDEQVLPVMTPLAIDQSHPFPQLGNKTLNVILSLDAPETHEEEKLVAILPVPRVLPRLILIRPDYEGPKRYIFLSEVVKLCAGTLFPGFRVTGAFAFRVTRNSDLYIDEEESENLLKKIEEELRNLRRGEAVRLEIEEGVDDYLFETLCGHLKLSHEYVFRLNGPINLLRVMQLCDIERPELKYTPFTPVQASPLRHVEAIFDTLRSQDVLLHQPYDAFTPVVDFVEQAARDPQVFAIKQTLYRTSGDSPIVRALIEASRNGKQVTALVELKARFDEANNIQWARQLEDAGVHVVYGLIGHKTHCKCSLVVRREGRAMKRYVHLGTGNYNPKTAKLYTDFSLFSARDDLTEDVANLFNALTGFGRAPEFKQLLVAPYCLHADLIALIDVEAANAEAGKPARIIVKVNSLVDKAIIDRLYAASRAGVKIDLIVRGVCCLVPGVEGLSENISVRSIVGRYLEHARVYYFENAGEEPRVFVGSADWMPRNFFRRIEVVFPLLDPVLRRWMIDSYLPIELQDNVDARVLKSNGAYEPVTRAEGEAVFSAQRYFMASAMQRAQQAAQG